jgi:hypothetical protein
MRVKHLEEAHSFGQCNREKKFFRTDQFRQHLKIRHAAVVGIWTDTLESACMMQRIAVGQIQMVTEQEGAVSFFGPLENDKPH